MSLAKFKNKLTKKNQAKTKFNWSLFLQFEEQSIYTTETHRSKRYSHTNQSSVKSIHSIKNLGV